MRVLVISYLFLKALLWPHFTHEDVLVAFALGETPKGAPRFVRKIGDEGGPAHLPGLIL